MEAMKYCKRCEADRPTGDFAKDVTTKDGLNNWCRKCKSEYKRGYRERNKEKIAEYQRRYDAANPEIILAGRERQKRRERDASRIRRTIRERARKAIVQHRSMVRAIKTSKPAKQCAVCELAFRGRAVVCSKSCRSRWEYANNREARRRYNREYDRRRYREDPAYCLRQRMHTALRRGLSRGSVNSSMWDHLPYGVDELQARLKATMPKNSTWQDFLDGSLHIDHIIPHSAYTFNSPDDYGFKECWALSNLQLMWGDENIRKGDKIDLGLWVA